MEKDRFERVTKECLIAIKNSNIHHLDLELRNDLFFEINDNLIKNYLIFNTSIKTYEIWQNHYPFDEKPFEVLIEIQNYIYKKTTSDKLLEKLNQLHTYLDNRLIDYNLNAVYAGYSILKCGYEIIYNKYFFNDKNDFESDPLDWQSCFFGSLAYNSGSLDFNDINPEKNLEFWLWFINEGLKMSLKKEILIFPNKQEQKIEIKKIPIRTQINSILEDKEIIELFEKIINSFQTILIDENWFEIKIENYQVSNNISNIGYFRKSDNDESKKIDNLKTFLLFEKANLNANLKLLRDKMYLFCSNEGAWFSLKVIVSKNSINYNFIYDEKLNYFENWIDLNKFADDFKLYKRALEFTPYWLENLISKN